MALNLNSSLTINGRVTGVSNINTMSRAVTGVGTAAGATRAQLKSLAGAFTAVFAGRQILGAFKGILEPTLQYQHALTKLRVATGANVVKMAELEKGAKAAAKQYGYGPTEAVTAMQALYSATGDVDKALKGLGATMQISQALGPNAKMGPGKVAADIVAPLAKVMGGSVDMAYAQYDRLAALAKEARVDLNEFSGETLNSLVKGSQRTGESLEELATGFAFMLRAGGSSTTARKNLDLLLTQMDKLKGKQGVPLTISGIQTRDPRTGQAIPLGEFIKKAISSGGVGEKGLKETFGKGAGQGLWSLVQAVKSEAMRTGMDPGKLWDRMYGSMGKSGQLKTRGATWEATFERGMDRFKASIDAAVLALGERLLPTLGNVASYAGAFVGIIGRFSKSGLGGAVYNWAARFIMFSAALFAGKAILWGVTRMLAVTRANVDSLKASLWSGALAAGGFWTKMKQAYTQGSMQANPIAFMQGKNSVRGVAGGLAAGVMVGIKAAAQGVLNLLGGWVGLLVTVITFMPQIAEGFTWIGQKLGLVHTLTEKEIVALEKVKDKDKQWMIKMLLGSPFEKARAAGQMMLDQQVKVQEKANKDRMDAERTAANLMVQASRQAAQYMQQGSTQWNDVVGRAARLMEYQTPRLDFGQVNVARRLFRSARKSMPLEAEGGLAASRDIEALLQAARTQKGGLGPKQMSQLMLATATVGGSLSRMHAAGLTGPDTVKNYLEKLGRGVFAWGGEGHEAETARTAALQYYQGGKKGMGKGPGGREWQPNAIIDLLRIGATPEDERRNQTKALIAQGEKTLQALELNSDAHRQLTSAITKLRDDLAHDHPRLPGF